MYNCDWSQLTVTHWHK